MIEVTVQVGNELTKKFEFISLKEAAEGYGLAETTVYNYSNTGALPSLGRLPDGSYVMELSAYERSKAAREVKRLFGRRRRFAEYR